MTWRRTIKQGLVAGFIGFATIVMIFAIVNLVTGRSPLYTAALLGSALFLGVEDPSMVSISAGAVLTYSAFHLLVFLLFGIMAAGLATLADRGWQLWFVSLFFFIFFSFHLWAAAQGIAAPMRLELSDVTVWGAGFAASLAMAWYLIVVHPQLRSPQTW